MPNEKSASSLAEQLSQARARIAELQSENELLRGKSASVQTPSFILESITDAFVAVDRQFRYIWINAEAERLMGMPREQLLGRCVWDLFPIGGVLEDKFRQALAEQVPGEIDYFHAPWNRWFYNKVYPTKEGGLAIYWREITEQKRAQADLRRQATVLEQVHDAIVIANLDGAITYFSPGAEKIFGYDAAEVLGQNVSLFYFEEDRLRMQSLVMEPLLRDGQKEIEVRNRRKCGEECYTRVSLSLLRDEAHEPYAMLGVSTDITARWQAEQLLRERKKRYRSLVDAMPHVAYLMGADGKTELINRYWQEYSGCPPELCLDFDWLAWVHPEDGPPFMAKWTECIETGESFEAEYRLRNAEGEYRWHLGRAVPLRGADGKISQWVGTATDIHYRRIVGEALRKSEERFRLAAQAVEGIVYDWDPRTGTVIRSGDLESILGIPVEQAEPTARWWQERIHPDDSGAASLNLMPLLGKDRSSFETEFRVRHADGHWVYACDRGYILRDEQGVPVRVVGSTYGISERKRLEQALEANNQRLNFQADILATTNDAVIALDSHQLVTYCNAGAERLYGVQASDVIGKPLSAIYVCQWLNSEDEERSWSDLAEKGSWKGESTHFRNDGSHIVVSSTVNMLSAQVGGPMVAVIRDVSERKEAEVAIRQHTAELSRANDDLLHFAYAVSHDLQAPLRTVSSFSQLLALKYKSKLDEQGDEFIGWIVDASSRMSTMINDLLEFAKVAGSEAEFDKAATMDEALATALANLRSEIEETGAVITHDPLPTVAADRVQLVQLLQNLIGNSLKYRKPETPPQIQISAERHVEEWVIGIRDNGIGFEERHAERIFGVFQRLNVDTAGTGVGLAICKRIVERRGGKIWATGKPGEGATLSFSIPTGAGQSRADWLTPKLAPRSYELIALPAPSLSAPFDELFRTLDLARCMVRDLNGNILIWTQGAERLFGWSKSEAVGQKAHDFLKTEFPKPLAEIEADLLRNGEWSGELRKFKRDGSAIWLASHWAIYRDGSGRPQSVIEVNNDITALKDAQAALLRSTEQRNLALRAGKMGVWGWDRNTGIVEWDETVESLLGMTPGSFAGTYEAFVEMVHPEDRAAHAARIQKAFENGPEFETENRVRHADGAYRWWCGQGKVTIGDDGKPAGLMGVVWDISVRKQAELDQQFLLDLSAKFTHSTDRRRLADLAVKEVGEYLAVSRCSYTEVDAAVGVCEVVAEFCVEGRSAVGEYSIEEFGDFSSDSANQFLAVSDAETDERVADKFVGTYEPLGVRAYVSVPLTGKSQLGACISVSDMNARAWQEREIALLRGVAERLWPALENSRLLQLTKDRQEQFETTFEQAAMGMAQVAFDGRWLHVNQRICEITGYSRQELLASRFQDITHPEDLESDLNQYAALQRGEVQSYAVEKRYFHRDGSIVWVNVTVAIRKDDSGVPRYAISVIEDITARKKVAQELAESTALAAGRLQEIEGIYLRAPVGLAVSDRNLRVIRINDCMGDMIGTPAADAIGRTLAELMPEFASRLEPIYRGVMESGSPVIDLEVRGIAAAEPGKERIWLASYFPLRGLDGGVAGVNAVVQDITQRNRERDAV